jgi:hypothetical protein
MSKVCENASYQVSCDIVGCDVLAHNRTLNKEFVLALHVRWRLPLRLHCN